MSPNPNETVAVTLARMDERLRSMGLTLEEIRRDVRKHEAFIIRAGRARRHRHIDRAWSGVIGSFCGGLASAAFEFFKKGHH